MTILVKRYSNRRLYDTERSQYLTLEDLARRLRAGEDFRVVDAGTDRDLTKRVLVQILLLESLELADVLPLEFLKTLIRIRDGRLRDLFVRYLKMNVEAFTAAQKQIEENLRLAHEQVAMTANLMKSVLPFSKGGARPDGGDHSAQTEARGLGEPAEADGESDGEAPTGTPDAAGRPVTDGEAEASAAEASAAEASAADGGRSGRRGGKVRNALSGKKDRSRRRSRR